MTPRRGWGLLCGLLAVALAAVAFLRATHETAFVQDDVPLVAENPRLLVGDKQDLKTLVLDRYWDRRRPHERLWRPLPMATFALEFRLWGPNPDAFHWANLCLHALCTFLVWLVFRWHVPRRVAWLGALIFAIHPVHSEAVASVVGRCELLALLFSTLLVYSHVRAREAGGTKRAIAWTTLGSAALLLACASKEVALAAPALCVLSDLVRRREGPPSLKRLALWLAPFLAYAGILGLYGLARHVVLNGELAPLEGAWALGRRTLVERLPVAVGVAREAMLSLSFPRRTAGHFPLPNESLASAGGLTSVVLHVLLIGFAIFSLARSGRLERALGAGVLGAYAMLLPSLNLVPIGVVQADRLLYSPSFFGCLALCSALGLLLRGRARRREAGAILLGAILLACIPRLRANVEAWIDPFHLWETTLERFPDSGQAHLELAQLHARRAPRDPVARALALEHLKRAVAAFEPRREVRAAARARCALARLVAHERPSDAIVLYEEARAIDPTLLEAYEELIDFYVRRSKTRTEEGKRMRDLRLAERMARKAANHVAPYAYVPWLRFGQVLGAMELREREADDALSRAIERSSDPWEARLARAELRARADPAAGLEDFQAVLARIRARPTPTRRAELPRALLGCVLGLRKAGRADEAHELVVELRERFPQSPEAKQLN